MGLSAAGCRGSFAAVALRFVFPLELVAFFGTLDNIHLLLFSTSGLVLDDSSPRFLCCGLRCFAGWLAPGAFVVLFGVCFLRSCRWMTGICLHVALAALHAYAAVRLSAAWLLAASRWLPFVAVTDAIAWALCLAAPPPSVRFTFFCH